MKRLFTLCVGALLVMGANAQVRKSWDFTQWSTETLGHLAADVAAGGGWTEEKAGESYQCGARTKNVDKGTPLTCDNGWEIPETKGLMFACGSAKHIVIAYNKKTAAQTTSGFAGSSFLWENGKNADDIIIIPKVRPGAEIKVVVESHSSSQERGWTVTKAVGMSGIASSATLIDGTETTLAPNTTTQVWKVAENAENPTDSVNVYLKTVTGGAHIYSIEVDGGDAPIVKEKPKYAFLYDSSAEGYDLDGDLVRQFISNNGDFTDFDIKDFTATGSADVTTASLKKNYDAVILSNSIAADNAFVPALKEIIAYVPVINLNANLYDKWGYGNAVATETNMITVPAEAKSSNLYTDIDTEADIELLAAGTITGWTPGASTYFASDSILGRAGDVNAIHLHNLHNRNAYYLVPMANGSMISENGAQIINNALTIATETKQDSANAIMPSIIITYKDKATDVTLSSRTADEIYYTLDGTEPSKTNGTLYTGVITLTDSVEVKAIAYADGFYPSLIADSKGKVAIKAQAKTPVIDVNYEDGKSTITLTNGEDDVDIYFNFVGNEKSTESQKYSEPIVLTKHATITAFALGDTKVQSVKATKDIRVDKEVVRLDTLVHMDSNKDQYGTGDLIAKYAYYSGAVYDTLYVKDEMNNNIPNAAGTGDSIIVTLNHRIEADSLSYKDFENGWAIGSYGQRINSQSATKAGRTIGDGTYGPATAKDFGFTDGAMSFLVTNNSYDPASAWIQTTAPVQAPFDVVVYMTGQASASYKEAVLVSVSTDNINWTVVGDTLSTYAYKNIDRQSVSYEGTDQVYVKVASANVDATSKQKTMIFDIFVLGTGENSEAYLTGINDVNNTANSEVISTKIYSVNGMLTNKAQRGINIVKKTYANGATKTFKVMVK